MSDAAAAVSTSSPGNEGSSSPGAGSAQGGTPAATSSAGSPDPVGANAGGEQRSSDQTGSPQPAAFKVPDEYKDRPWAAKVKNEADLYKQIDNLSSLAGKKQIPAPDAEAKVWDEFYNGLRPESVDAYNFGENHPNPEFAKSVGQVLYDAGISKHQAEKIIPAYQALEQKMFEAQTSADGFKEVMTKSFGEKYDGAVASVVKEHKQHLSAEDQKIMDAMPNEYLGAVYRLTAAMQKAYGVEESGAHTGKSGAPAVEDIAKVRSGIRQEIAQLESRPHTAAEKQALVDKLQKTYDDEGKKR